MKVIAIFSAILAVVASYPRLGIPTSDLYRGNGNYAYPGNYAAQMNYVHSWNNYMGGPATRTGPAYPFNYDSRDGHEGPVDPPGFTDHTGLSEYPGHYSGPNHAGSVDHVNYGYHDGLEHDGGPADYAGPAGYTGYDHPHHGDPPGYAGPPDYDYPASYGDIRTDIDHGWTFDYPGPASHGGPPVHGGPIGHGRPPGYDYLPGYEETETWQIGREGPSDYGHPTTYKDIQPYMNHEGPPDVVAPPSPDDSPHLTSAYVGPKVKTWTAKELFDAINANSDDESMPSIQEAANQILLALFTNYNWKNVLAAIPSPSGQKTWKLEELEQYSEIPEIDEEFRAALDHAHHLFIDLLQANPHVHIQTMPVVIGAVDISTWNMKELTQALQDPNIKPELKTRLQKALQELQLRATSDRDKISIVTRIGLIDNNPEYYELSIPPELLPLLKEKAKYAFDEPDHQ